MAKTATLESLKKIQLVSRNSSQVQGKRKINHDRRECGELVRRAAAHVKLLLPLSGDRRLSSKTARDKKAFHDDSRLNQQELLTKAQTSYFQIVLQNGLDLRRAQASY